MSWAWSCEDQVSQERQLGCRWDSPCHFCLHSVYFSIQLTSVLMCRRASTWRIASRAAVGWGRRYIKIFLKFFPSYSSFLVLVSRNCQVKVLKCKLLSGFGVMICNCCCPSEVRMINNLFSQSHQIIAPQAAT